MRRGPKGSGVVLAVGVDVSANRTATVSPMQKWEYVTVPLLVHATKQILDNWGDDGWELVAVLPGPNPENLVAYLKRPKPDGA